jgi:amino acid adenylation domain-containing protein/non-ribosomal peptide synthase protein (TIGR01720 family)
MEHKIAVIGMAGRFPDANDLTEFYTNLQQAKCSIREISPERIRRTTLDPDAAYHRRGYIENIDEFDYQFFNIPYGEAIHMDPHQRLLLEVVAEAIENCGYSLKDFNDTNTAVYVADKRLQYYEHAEQFDPTLVTGNSSEFLAARINRVFNLKGGVAVIDTSCSSALVAVHNACNELRLGLAEQALVCGVNLELFPTKNAQYKLEVDSPDGFSIPFTAASNGMVYGEAVICVVLKPLTRALQDKDHIQAVITGSAVNNNAARAASLTTPDSIAQAEVLRKAWASAGVEPGMLGFIEAHGSGTQIGDSLEIAGINLATEPYAENNISIPISTVKSNIGHARSAAGLAGFVKAVLAVKTRSMLPSVYNDPPNPHLQLKDSRVRIQRTSEDWNYNGNKIMGGVSSIGFSGTNCHVVVEQGQKQLNGHHLPEGNQPYLFLFSSWKEQELTSYVKRAFDFISQNTIAPEDLSFTLGRGRDHYEYRKAFVATDIEELKGKLSAYIHSCEQAVKPASSPKLIFIFSPGDLITYSAVEACCRSNRYFSSRYQYYLEKVSTGMERIAPQIFRFIYQLAYYDLLVHHGIETATLIGIGTGQLIARVVRNELTVEEGLRKAYETTVADATETGLQEKLERMLQSQASSQPVIFVEVGMGSSIYPLLLQHAGHGRNFFVHQLPAVLPVLDITELQAFLYHRNYSSPLSFFGAMQGKRIELPAHPFSKTRCWIREEPRKKAECTATPAQQQQKSSGIAYTNTVVAFVSGLWKEVLELSSNAVLSHFFETGGDSIKATKVIRRLNDVFEIRLDFEDLFDYPSLESFSALVASKLTNEQRLMLIWKDVLGYTNLKPSDNFFEKGGHSLLANQVLNRMKAEMKVKVDFEDFFKHPSIESMCRFLNSLNADAKEEQIPAVSFADDYPVSHLQRRLWILAQLEESSVAYNEFNAYNLDGALNVQALKEAITQIMQRHEGLRTIFIDGADGPRQKILPYSASFEMVVEDISADGLSSEEITEQVRNFAKTPFILSAGPLVRTKLIRVQKDKHLFLFNIHHIIFDEWSNQVFIKELAQLYIAISSGQNISLQPLRVQYKDYASWLQTSHAAGTTEAAEYWLGLLKNGAPVLELPTDLPRPPQKTYNGSSLTIDLAPQLKQIIDELAANNSASTFMTLSAITSLLLHRYSGQDTIIVGTPVAGRKDVDMESCIGFFANTVILKAQINTQDTFLQLLAAVKKQVAGAYTHQLYPFDLLVEQLNIRPDRSRMPLFDVMIGYQKNTGVSNNGFEMQGVKVSGFGQPRETSKFDLLLDFFESASGLSLTITYNTDLFLPERILRMARHFGSLTEQLKTHHSLPLQIIDYRTQEDMATEQVWQKSSVNAMRNPYLLFLEQVKERPSATAVYGKGWRVSYENLYNNACKLSYSLHEQFNIASGDQVGIQLDNITERITAMIALAQLGASIVFISEDIAHVQLKHIINNQSYKFDESTFTDAADNFTIGFGDTANLIDTNSLANYIEWFKENIPCVAGSYYWMNTGTSAQWVENVWAGLAAGLGLLQRESNEPVGEKVTGLVLTAYELQLMSPDSSKWIITDGNFRQHAVEVKSLLRPSIAHPAIAEIVNTSYPYSIKPLPGVVLQILDAQGMPAVIGINGTLQYRTSITGEWQQTGITCRCSEKDSLLLVAAEQEVASALLNKKNIAQLVISDNKEAIYISPVKRNADKPVAQEDHAHDFKPASEHDLKLLEAFNSTGKDLPSKTIIQLLQERALVSPDKISVSCKDRSLTYKELHQASDIIAQHLVQNGINSEEIIPVYAERSPELLIAMLGIMKAGAAYLPLGMDIPSKRMSDIVNDCGARFMLVNQIDQSTRFSEIEIQGIQNLVQQFDIISLLNQPLDAAYDLPAIALNSLAYVIYTSGSTGRPKGVMIEHVGMMNHLLAKIELLHITDQTKVIQNAPQSFDISIWQFLSALAVGGQTIIYPDALVEDPEAFAGKLMQDEPQILEVVPSYLGVLLDVFESNTKHSNWKPQFLLVTGEAFAPKIASRWFDSYPNVPLVNAYGPTEASDDITHYVFNSVDKNIHRLPIGSPIRNMKIYILNQDMQPCALGSAGEICVSGIGVGRGYIGQPEKTKEVFVDNPFEPGTRMYRTGDLGYFTETGLVEFLGRKDHQVKIHGHRIETAEIEHCLCQVEGVLQSVVLNFRSADENDFLAAWLLTDSVDDVKAESVKTFLKEKLPPYMVPAYIFFRDKLPLTANGKIDRKAFPNPEQYKRKKIFETEARQYLSKLLPEYRIPEIIAIDQIPLTGAGVPEWQTLQEMVWTEDTAVAAPPVTDTEKGMAVIWQQLLNVESIGIDDDFFSNGGHSLKGMRLLAAIENKFGQRLSLRHLFTSPTIRQLSLKLEQQQKTLTLQIPVQPQQEYYPVSYAQRRMWVMSRLGNHAHAYNICGALQLKGNLNRRAWDDAWMQLIQRHEILRMGFSLVEGEVKQFVVPAPTAAYNIAQLDVSKHKNPLEEVYAIHRAHEQMVFQLEQPPLLRGSMVRTADNEFVFIYVLHHIISDEWSLELLSRELLQFYTDNVHGQTHSPELLNIQYRDFACWQRDDQQQHWQDSSAYWQQKLRSPLPVLELPIDGTRPAVKTYAGATESMLMHSMAAQLSDLGQNSGATLFMMLTAGVKIFLQRYCHQDDIIIGTPVAGRTHPQLQNSAGLFLNTLALRTAIRSDDSFYDVIKKVRYTTLDAFDHQDYPFDKLVEELDIKKDLSRSALFDVLLVQHDEVENGKQTANIASLEVKPFGIPPTASKFDLSFHFRRNGDDLEAGLNFNTALFSAARAKLMLAHFNELLSGLLSDPSCCIQSINYTSPAERKSLLAVNVNNWQPPAEENICTRMVAVWSSRQQQHAAVDATGKLSFAELDEVSNKMAHYLADECGIKQGQVVGLYMDRSNEMVISMLSILKAGATYLPMDKSFPVQRLDYMLQDSGTALVISDEQWTGSLPSIVWSSAFKQKLDGRSSYAPVNKRTPGSIVYIIYTSGTSGKPKGVGITDKAVINYAAGIETAYHLHGRKLRGLLASSIAFDLGYTCLWGMLLNGGELHLLPQTPYWQPQQVLEWIGREKINFIKLTPSHFRLLVHELAQQPALEEAAGSLQWIILGGEKPSPADMQQWLQLYPDCRIANHYGPTETTVGVLTQLISNEAEGQGEMSMTDFAAQPVLGEPMGSHHIYIVDRNGMLCGTGVWGEMLIGGNGLSPGYVNRPELTAQKFIDNPFASSAGKLYRTGDRCRRLLNGKIEFSGRLDAQVQLKGYRVEPEEIENVLLQMKEISQAAVIIHNQHNEERLIAYIVSSDTEAIIDQDAARAHVAKQLPMYMVPSRIIQLPVMPLTGNGKTDRNQLPDPTLFDTEITEECRPVKNKAEEDLLAAFDSLMNGRQINITSNFFQLGGDSIKAIQLASRLYGMGWKLDIKDVFDHPVLEEMAVQMQVVKQVADQRAVEGEVPLSPIQYDFFKRGFLFEHHYNQSVLLKSTERLDTKAVVQVVKKLLTHHDALRMVFIYIDGLAQQYNRGVEIETEVFDIDLRNVDDPVKELAHQSQNLQEGFDLEEGPLLKAAIFRLPEDDRLLLIAHHLIVDGVSWRIILEDLNFLYHKAKRGEELKPGLKTDSFKKWTEQIHQLASDKDFETSQSYWYDLDAANQHLLWDTPARSQRKDRVITGFELDEGHTGLLLSGVQHAYHTEINEIFLAALAACISGIYQADEIWVAMEGHGRENLVAADVSRTVGWFTSVYPVLLDARKKSDIGTHIRGIKEQLRAIPNKGMGYGMLKYLGENVPAVCNVQPEIVFNYLGQFDNDDNMPGFSFAPEYTGESSHLEERIMYPLAITGRVLNDKLRMNFEFDPLKVSSAEQDAICLQFEKQLLQLIYHCASRKDTEHTASDFQYKAISQETFESLFD